ncbi:MAG TPA: hypothetical protein VN514_01155 [Ignavibacteria bacterium]|nr:hypothetical protein [Ignavibacteria bacterium]
MAALYLPTRFKMKKPAFAGDTYIACGVSRGKDSNTNPKPFQRFPVD